jgi:diguanylate cyclase (GGDEF)-like protein
MKVLIADDDPVSRRLLEASLRNWNYDVVTVADGVQALEALQSDSPPRLAVLDWVMPGKDGPQVCRELRAKHSDLYTYIVLLTSRTHKADVAEGLEAGADDYVTKPFEPLELKARLLAGARIIELQEQLLAAQHELRYRATHDALTGLLNRAAIMERLEEELGRARRHEHLLTVVLVDIDGFKQINDEFGHQAGDAVLQAVAQRLNTATRVYDAVGRYGGDEFLIVLPCCDSSMAGSLAARFHEAVRPAGMVEKNPALPVTCSFGVATAFEGNAESTGLIRSADVALYRAKMKGRDRFELAVE